MASAVQRWRLMLTLTCALPWLALAQGAHVDCASLERARVAEVYPTASELPENLLRLYVYFTQPMERTDPAAQVTLRDAQGRLMDGALLGTRFGLWSADGKRLTLLLNPGRVKSGLGAHERLGPVLQSGQSYVLRIEPGLRDAKGCAMATGYERRVRAGPADRTPPDPADWSLLLPLAQTRQALTIALHGLTDHLSLAYRIRVLDEQGRTVPGAISLLEHERTWRFVPTRAWLAGTYVLRVDPTLEDLAGNRPTGLFDDPTSNNRERSARAINVDRVFVLSE